MTESTSDAEDFADYTDEHQSKPPPDRSAIDKQDTPDVDTDPDHEPPD